MSCGCNTSGAPYVDLTDERNRPCRVSVRAIHRVEQREDGCANLWWCPDDVPFGTSTPYADAIAAMDAALTPRRVHPTADTIVERMVSRRGPLGGTGRRPVSPSPAAQADGDHA